MHQQNLPCLQRRLAEGRKAFDKLVRKISGSADAEEFVAAVDRLSLFIIDKGIPEDVLVTDAVKKVEVAYLDFNTPCKGTGSLNRC